jgi:L-fuconolactonase
MRIDAEVRFWRRTNTPERFHEMPLLTQDYLPQHLEPHLMEHGFTGCIAVLENELTALSSMEHDTLIASRHILGIVPRLPEHARLASNPEAGILGYHLPVFTGSTPQLKQLDTLCDLGLPLSVDLARTPLASLRDLIEAKPTLQVILNHYGRPEGEPDEFETANGPWLSALQWLHEHPQTVITLSGLINPSDAGHFDDWDLPEAHFKPRLADLMAVFGEDRILFSSNWPIGLMSASFEDTLDLMTTLIDALSPTSLAKIMGLNAARCYGIEP